MEKRSEILWELGAGRGLQLVSVMSDMDAYSLVYQLKEAKNGS